MIGFMGNLIGPFASILWYSTHFGSVLGILTLLDLVLQGSDTFPLSDHVSTILTIICKVDLA